MARRERIGWWVALIGLLLAQVALTQPSFLHASWHGSGLVEGIFGFPHPATHRASYGQVSFFVLGAIAALFGQRFEVVALTNQVFGVIALGLLSECARRLSGGRALAGWAVLALLGLSPAWLRVTASEDAHVLALVFAAASLLLVVVWTQTDRLAALVGSGVACVLMLWTRQTFTPWALLVIGVPVAARHTPRAWRAFAATVLIAMLVRVLTTASDGSEQTSLFMIPILLASGSLVGSMLHHHVLLDVLRFGPTLTVALGFGAWAAWRARGARRWLLAGLAGYFVLTLPMGFPTPGVELAFRVPVIALAVLLGAVAFAESAAPRWVQLAGALGCLALPLVFPARALLSWQATDYLDYLALRERVALLPPAVTVVQLPSEDPSWQPPLHLFRQRGIDARLAPIANAQDPQRPAVLVAGVQCWGHALGEGLDVTFENVRALLGPTFERVYAHDVDPRRDGVSAVLRPDCARFIEGAERVGTEVELPVTQDAPFATYAVDRVPFSVWLRRGAVTSGSAP